LIATAVGKKGQRMEDMEKIMWKNAARLWKLNPQIAARKAA
jgi:predicted TIM-barrel fold metal-dependent hydrolase